ncbi:IclR family transcriptional regulator [Oceanobacillus sp. CF4.6]|uniref:IclR family transcriptional regulator n=1 Tax=Oceanobacillus sp. CF4.6 TaxID=3373080 RepID=UPI003EE6E4AF
MTEETKQGIQSIELGIKMLKIISDYDRPLTITEISNLCDISKSKAYRYLISFVKTGFLQKNENLKYSIGNELILIGVRAHSNVDIDKLSTSYISELRDKINETVSMALWGEKGPFFLKWEPSNSHVNIGVQQGTQIKVTQSATGKLFAAFSPREKTEKLINEELNGDQTAIDSFYNELKIIREKKFATTQDTLIPAISALSAPVFGKNGEIDACISVIGFTESLDVSEDSIIAKELKKNAYLLSRDMGYVEKRLFPSLLNK